MEFGTVTIKLLYFAWVREKIGKDQEILDLPPGIATVAELIAWLGAQGPEYAEAFARPGVVRAAIDRKHVQPASPIAGAREIALFPPVTGG
jgi:molybdopterin synthase sulfur carrier subunit